MKTAALTKDGAVLIPHVELATGLRDRMRGLLGRDELPLQQAMWISPCNSIHTFCMQFSLDLVFLDRNLQVVRIVRDVPPARMVHGGPGAHSVLELQAGWLGEDALVVGERLAFVSLRPGCISA